MRISDVCIKTNVGSTMILKDVRDFLDLRMDMVSTLAIDRVSYCKHLGNGRWKLTKGSLIVARGHACCGMYMTHVKTYKKFNKIKDFKKNQELRIKINGVDAKREKFSLPDSTTDKEVIGDEEYEDAKATW